MTETEATVNETQQKPAPLIEIDPGKCVACGQCTLICPTKAIIRQEGKIPPKFAENGRCIRCGHCVSICPTGAIKHIEMATENFRTIKSDWTPDMIEMLLCSKRSVRYFTEKPVEKETIEKLLEVAVQAPSDGNNQDRSFVVLTDRSYIEAYETAIIDAYRAFLEQQLAAGVDPMFWKFQYIRPLLAKHEAGEHPIFRNASCVICAYAKKEDYFGSYNCVAAMDYLMLMAHSMGLGSCILGFGFNPSEIGHKFLGLSDSHLLHSVVAIGHPKYKFRRTVSRRPPEITWHSPTP